MNDLTTVDGVKNHLSQSKSDIEWNNRLDEILKVNNGYPSFWFLEIMASGFAAQVVSKFGGSDQITVTNI